VFGHTQIIRNDNIVTHNAMNILKGNKKRFCGSNNLKELIDFKN